MTNLNEVKVPSEDEPIISFDPETETPPIVKPKRRLGACVGLGRIISDDKDYLDDFKEYME
jgi:hypothetical protein